jgi:hypothetical protein
MHGAIGFEAISRKVLVSHTDDPFERGAAGAQLPADSRLLMPPA